MNSYLFFLGVHPELSAAELKAVFSAENIDYKIITETKKNFVISTKSKINCSKIMDRLGGTIKIARAIEKDKNPIHDIVNFLDETQKEGKIQFSITGAGKQDALKIKKLLKEKGRSVRYIEIKNTASILHNNLVKKQGDLSILDGVVYVTEAVQQIAELSKRDFGRPGADSFSGMLPPKLSRMMLNLADAPFASKILDAFCGSGTVLTEAIAMGYKNILGSDISKKAIEDSEKNIQWIIKEKNIKNLKYELILSDAANLDNMIEKNSVQSIISEPYMGKPLHGNENKKNLTRQTEELAQIYIDSFKSFHKILRQDGSIIFIIPSFKAKDEWIKIDCLDEIKKIGFDIVPLSEKSPFLRYQREGQHLARDIWKIIKK